MVGEEAEHGKKNVLTTSPNTKAQEIENQKNLYG